MKERYKHIRKTRLVQYLAAVAVLFIVASIVFSSLRNSYEDLIEKHRKDKDLYFSSGEDSPLENKSSFKGLSYYPPDKAYLVTAQVFKLKDDSLLPVRRNDGKRDLFSRYARAQFQMNGRNFSLTLLKAPKDSGDKLHLFVPFADLTNGNETYETGRYLDLAYAGGNTIEIDFNLAYNPFCAYSYAFSCPLPPKENVLDTEIKAGEKKYLPG